MPRHTKPTKDCIVPRSIMSHVKAKTCPACGKKFDCMPDTWRFMFRDKRGNRLFCCTWSCYRKATA